MIINDGVSFWQIIFNNFKELGLATTQYVADNHDWYFNYWNGGPGSSYGKSNGSLYQGAAMKSGYKGLLAQYLGSENCDFIAELPMPGGFESLNAGVAAAVTMYEILRQRGK